MCGVATQGNPSADDWTKTYKIETSIDNINWEFYTEDNAVKVLVFSNGFKSSTKYQMYSEHHYPRDGKKQPRGK